LSETLNFSRQAGIFVGFELLALWGLNACLHQ
jgi:hypothetical protein